MQELHRSFRLLLHGDGDDEVHQSVHDHGERTLLDQLEDLRRRSSVCQHDQYVKLLPRPKTSLTTAPANLCQNCPDPNAVHCYVDRSTECAVGWWLNKVLGICQPVLSLCENTAQFVNTTCASLLPLLAIPTDSSRRSEHLCRLHGSSCHVLRHERSDILPGQLLSHERRLRNNSFRGGLRGESICQHDRCDPLGSFSSSR